MATFSGRGDGTGVKNPRLKSPFPDIEPRFGGAFFYVDANALYALKSRGFGGETGLVTERFKPDIVGPVGVVQVTIELLLL